MSSNYSYQTPPIDPRSVNTKARGLGGMAFTELWERFSYYGLQGLLPFYLLFTLDKGGLDLGPVASAGIVGAYGGMIYVAQLLGAWLGDRLVSPKMLVLYGGSVIFLGHLALGFLPGMFGLITGLILIIIGTGALKTNITAIVGYILDEKGEGERDAGFSYFYAAINMGAVLGPLSTGYLQDTMGFHWGFGLAAIGMGVALIQYVFSMRQLPDRANVVLNPLPRTQYPKMFIVLAAAVGFIVVGHVLGWWAPERLAVIVTFLALGAAAAYFAWMLTAKNVTRPEKTRVAGFIPLFLAGGLYFGLLFQQFTTIAIMISERVALSLFGWSFPVAWITMLSQLAAVIVTPLVALIWIRMGDRQTGSAGKFGIGLIQIGIAYAIMMLALRSLDGAMIPLALIILVMIIAGSSEVFIGPIGLSLASRIGPESMKAQMVGLNFLTLALGSSLSGLLGQFYAAADEQTYFLLVTALGLISGLLLIVFRHPLRRAMRAGFEPLSVPEAAKVGSL